MIGSNDGKGWGDVGNGKTIGAIGFGDGGKGLALQKNQSILGLIVFSLLP
jgi:hypothetical protein